MGLMDRLYSKMPSWVRRQPTAPPEVLAKLQEEVQIPIRDSFNTVRGWRFLDVEYTLGEGEAPRDPEVTKAIHKFDPDMIPLWARWRYLSPADDGEAKIEIFGRHVVARHLDNPTYEPLPLAVVMPPSYNGKVPNKIEFQWDGMLFGETDPRGRDLPGPYLAWDWRLYEFCNKGWSYYQSTTLKEKKADLATKPFEKGIKERIKRRMEQDKINKDLQREVNKILNTLSDEELEKYFMGGKFIKPEKAKQVGYTGKSHPKAAKIVLTDVS